MKLEQILTCLVKVTRQTMQADAAAIRLLDNKENHLRVAAASEEPAALQTEESIPIEQSPPDQKALAGQTSIIEANAGTRVVGVPARFGSLLCAPLACEGKNIGALHVYAERPQSFDEKDAGRLSSLGELGAKAITAARESEDMGNLKTSRARFTHIATHELRSSITVAQSLVRNVLQGYAGELTEKQSDIFDRVNRQLDYLESLVNDLLDLAASTSPELVEEEEPVAVNASVGRATLLLQPRAEEKGVDLVHRTCCEELVIWGTEDGLDRIFVNLIGNAVKYTPAGGSVTVSLGRVEEEIQIKVVDTGIGIPEEAQPRIFDEFYRAPNAKETGEIGTGLGLTIVKDLVEHFKGDIKVESTVGEGSTFTVTFPIHRFSE